MIPGIGVDPEVIYTQHKTGIDKYLPDLRTVFKSFSDSFYSISSKQSLNKEPLNNESLLQLFPRT